MCRARILIVEDDPDAADLFAIWLREAGHSVSIVSDAARALILAPVLRPTVTVIDLGLPEIDGLSLIGMLRLLPALSQCQHIAVTAYAGAEFPKRCREAGFAAFLAKPMPSTALVQSVFDVVMSEAISRYH